ncbi:hypothetical protein XI01_14255 [Bradyrhizobium sp. CCBAU 21360]|nr:hypothetical protein [Bradyrhizobium sp. CCBAU 21360]
MYAVAVARDQARQLGLRRLNESGPGGEIRFAPKQLFFHMLIAPAAFARTSLSTRCQATTLS